MKALMKTATAVMGTLAFGLSAEAGVTQAQVNQLMAMKQLQLVTSQTSPDGAVKVTVVREQSSGSLFAIGVRDLNGDGIGDILGYLSFVPNSGGASLNAINDFNAVAFSSGYLADGNANLKMTFITPGTLDMRNASVGFEVFKAELKAYAAAIGGRASMLGVSLGIDDPYVIDRGMTRVEVTARDDALTSHLNQTRGEGALGAYDGEPHQKLIDQTIETLLEAKSPF